MTTISVMGGESRESKTRLLMTLKEDVSSLKGKQDEQQATIDKMIRYLKKHNYGDAVSKLQEDLTETTAQVMSHGASFDDVNRRIDEEAAQRAKLGAWLKENFGLNLEHLEGRLTRSAQSTLSAAASAARSLVEEEAAHSETERRKLRLEVAKDFGEDVAAAEARARNHAEGLTAELRKEAGVDLADSLATERKVRDSELRALEGRVGERVAEVSAAATAAARECAAGEVRAAITEEKRAREAELAERDRLQAAAEARVKAETQLLAESVVAKAIAAERKNTAEDLGDTRDELLRKMSLLRAENTQLRADLNALREEVAHALTLAKAAASSAPSSSSGAAGAHKHTTVAASQDARKLAQWLSERGLGRHLAVLEEQGFLDAPALMLVTDADLDTMGITAPGHRKALLAAVAELRECGGAVDKAVFAERQSKADEEARRREAEEREERERQEREARRRREREERDARRQQELEALAQRARKAEEDAALDKERQRQEREKERERRDMERREEDARRKKEAEDRAEQRRRDSERESQELEAQLKRLEDEELERRKARVAKGEEERQARAKREQDEQDERARKREEMRRKLEEEEAAAAARRKALEEQLAEEERKAKEAAEERRKRLQQQLEEEEAAAEKRRKENEEAAERKKKEEEEEEAERKRKEEEEAERKRKEEEEAAERKKKEEEEAAEKKKKSAVDEEEEAQRRRMEELERKRRELEEQERELAEKEAALKAKHQAPVRKVQQKKVQQKKVQQKKVQQKKVQQGRALPTKQAPVRAAPPSVFDEDEEINEEPIAEEKPAPAPAPAKPKAPSGGGPTFYAKKTPAAGGGGSVGGDLDTSDEELNEAVHGVRADDDPTSWIVMGYGGSKTALQLYAKGEGDLEEFIGALDEFDSEVVYGYLRVFYGENARPKFVFVTFVPEGLSGMAKAKANMHKTAVERFVQSFHTYFNISNTAEINGRLVEEKLHAAGGAHYGRGEGGGVSGGGEDFGGMKRLASQNFAAKGATILSTAKSPKTATGTAGASTFLSTKARDEPAPKRTTTTTTTAAAAPAPKKVVAAAAAPPAPKPQRKRADSFGDDNNDDEEKEDRFAFKKPQLRSVTKAAPAAGSPAKKKSIFEELGGDSDNEAEEAKKKPAPVKKAAAPAPAAPKKVMSFEDEFGSDSEDEEEKRKKKEEEEKKMEEDKFMSDYQKRKQALMQKKAAAAPAPAPVKEEEEDEEEETPMPPPVKEEVVVEPPKAAPAESEEDKIAKTIEVIKDKGIKDDEIGMIAVLYSDIKGEVDEKMIFKLRDRGQILFTGSSLDDDDVLSFIEDP